MKKLDVAFLSDILFLITGPNVFNDSISCIVFLLLECLLYNCDNLLKAITTKKLKKTTLRR